MNARKILSLCGLVLLTLFVVGQSRTAFAIIQAELESIREGQVVSGIVPISGWAFASSGVSVSVELFIDDVSHGIVPCCVDRPDVEEVFGAFAGESGFGQVFNFGRLEGIGEDTGDDATTGLHLIRIEIGAGAGESMSIERAVTVVRPGGYEFLERPSLLGTKRVEINDAQEVVIENVVVRDSASELYSIVTLRLAWEPNIQQLVIVGSDTTAGGLTDSSFFEPLDTIVVDDETAITAVLENPPGQTVSSQVTAGGIGVISGWAFSENSTADIGRVSLRIDGEQTTDLGAEIPCCSERTDVTAVFPEAGEKTGFAALVNFNRVLGGKRTIGIEIEDTSDPPQSRIMDHEVAVVRLGGADMLESFDLTEADADITGSLLVLEDAKVRAKGSQETQTVSAGFYWNESCQCFLPWPVCGNGGRDGAEDCDGTDFGSLSCQSFGADSGELVCNNVLFPGVCTLDSSQCTGGSPAFAYVTLVVDDAVVVIDTSLNVVTDEIPVGDRPRGIAVRPDNPATADVDEATEIYVVNSGDNDVSIIEVFDGQVRTVVDSVDVGDEPQGIAFSPDGLKAYVTNVDDDTVSVVNTTTRLEEAVIEVGGSPQFVAVTPDGLFAYVTNNDDDTVTVIDLSANLPLGEPIPVGEGPMGVAVSPDGTRAYVANFGASDTDDGDENGDTLSIIDTATNTVRDMNEEEEGVQPLQVGVMPFAIAFVPDTALAIVKDEGPEAFVSNFLEASVSVIKDDALDLDAGPQGSFGVLYNPRFNAVDNEPAGIAITPNGLRGYVALFGSRSDEGEVVQVFSTLTRGVVGSIEIGEKPYGIAIGPR